MKKYSQTFKTVYKGVFYRMGDRNDKIFYIRYTIKGDRFEERIGRASEGVSAKYSANIRVERLQLPEINKIKVSFEFITIKYLEYIVDIKDIYTRKIRIAKYILPRFGKKKLSDITSDDIMDFRRYLESLNKFQPQTIKHYLVIIRQIFNFAKKHGYYKGDNPASTLYISLPKIDNSRNMYMNDDEIKTYINYCNSSELPNHYSAIFLIALYTGMRKSEILNLKWSEIHLKEQYVRLTETKSKKNQIIMLSDIAIDVLKNIKEEANLSDYVFCYPSGVKIMDVKKVWMRFKKATGIRKDLRFHDIRHTFGTQAVTAGIPLDVVQRMMTHSDIKTTQRYAHIVDKRLRNAADTVNLLYKNLELN